MQDHSAQAIEAATEKKTRRKASPGVQCSKGAARLIEDLQIHAFIVDRLQSGEPLNASIVTDQFGVNRFRIMAHMEAIKHTTGMIFEFDPKIKTYVFTNRHIPC